MEILAQVAKELETWKLNEQKKFKEDLAKVSYYFIIGTQLLELETFWRIRADKTFGMVPFLTTPLEVRFVLCSH